MDWWHLQARWECTQLTLGFYSCRCPGPQLTAQEYGGGHDATAHSDSEDDDGITRAPPPGMRGAGDVTMAQPAAVSSLLHREPHHRQISVQLQPSVL